MAFSYASYAGNGSNKNFSVPFPYLLKAHVKVYTGFNILDGTYTSLLVEGTDYTWTSGTQVQTTVAPANGVTLTVLRDTPDSSQLVPWTDGSNLVSNDLNTADLQNLYVVQEQQDRNDAGISQSLAAQATANAAQTAANAAVTTANAAQSTANTASTNASAAVATANTAASNASAAVTTANTASSNASAAVTTANAANSAANTASTNATSAVTTANTASYKADQAIAAISSSINYQLKANVAAIPASPANDTYIEVQDSTGLESFTPLAGLPAGFVGDPGLAVRLRYTTVGSTWNWLNYYASNPETRYLKLSGGVLTGQIKADDSTSAATPGYAFDGDTNTGIGRPGADELALITAGQVRLSVDSAGNVAVPGALTKGGNNVVTVGDTGTITSSMIADGAIVNADINAAAAIAGSKISPDFAGQNVVTTGSATAGTFLPTSSTAPTAGVFLPSGNAVGVSTNGLERFRVTGSGAFNFVGAASGVAPAVSFSEAAPVGSFAVDSSGRTGLGTTSPTNLLHIRSATDARIKIDDTTNSHLIASITAANAVGSGSTVGHLYLRGMYGVGFSSDGGASTGMTLDNSARLLLGKTSSFSSGTYAQNARLQITGNSALSQFPPTPGVASLARNDSAFNVTTGQQLGVITFGTNDGKEFAWLGAIADSSSSNTSLPGALTFNTCPANSTNPIERMRVSSAGTLLIGCTDTPSAFVSGVSINNGGATFSAGNTTSSVMLIRFANSNGTVGAITVSGSGTTYATSSDYRLKENVSSISNAVDRIKQLNPSRFNFISDKENTVDGFLAHEVQQVVPEAVIGEKDAVDSDGNPVYQSIDHSKLVPLLAAALKEALGKIEDLEARLDELAAK